MTDKSEAMRMHLASAGIFLDDKAERRAHTPQVTIAAEPDRDEIRRILLGAGCSEAELSWMVPSCPSVGHAKSYRPTIKSQP